MEAGFRLRAASPPILTGKLTGKLVGKLAGK
jgi:hypothetical protein